MYGSCDKVHDGETERWTDGQTEKVTHRGGCPTWKSIILEWKVKEQKYIGQNLEPKVLVTFSSRFRRENKYFLFAT